VRLLLLGGGGTLGAFSAGALEVLHASGWRPDAVIGSSAGGINLLRYLAGGPEEPARFWRGLDLRALVRALARGRVARDGLLDPASFRARVDDGLDYARLLADDRLLAFLVVDLGTGEVRIRGNRTERSPAALRAVAHASFALPPLLRPVALDGALLADGGLLHNAPLDAAVDLGATEIVYLCNVHVLPRQGFRERGALPAARRFAEIFLRRASNVGFADAEIVDGEVRGVPLFVIAPPASLRVGAVLRWAVPTVDAMDHLVRQGRLAARAALVPSRWIERCRAAHAEA
jgi:NTE family protein